MQSINSHCKLITFEKYTSKSNQTSEEAKEIISIRNISRINHAFLMVLFSFCTWVNIFFFLCSLPRTILFSLVANHYRQSLDNLVA